MTQHIANRSLLELKISDLLFYTLSVVVLLLECSCFFLKQLPASFFKICGYNMKLATVAIIGLSLFFYVILNVRRKANASYLFGLSLVAFSGMCGVLCIVSCVEYNASLTSVLSLALPFIVIPLAYFLFHEAVNDEAKYRFLLSALIIIASIYSILCLLESAGVKLMDSNYQYESLRDGRLRLVMSGDFIAFGMILALGRAFKSSKGRLLNIFLAALMAFELYWVAQTRFLFIGVFAAATVGFLISGKNKLLKIVFVLLTVTLFASQFSNQISSLIFPDELDVSSAARINAYSYYWSHAGDLGVFGLGYIPSGNSHSSLLSMITISGSERGDITDIGIIGYLSRYGIMGGAVLVLFACQFIKGFMKRDKARFTLAANPEAWMALAFVLAVSPTMAITDAQRIIYLPLVFLLVEHALVGNATATAIEKDLA